MRRFLSSSRLWGTECGPVQEWFRPHVLWLPYGQPDVLEFFRRYREEVLAPYADIVTPVAEPDLHWTIQAAYPRTSDAEWVGEKVMERAARAVRRQLANLAPFAVHLGPASIMRSAATVAIWPEDQATALTQRVRAGLSEAGMVLPPPEHNVWPHMSLCYGARDCRTPELAARSDELASALVRQLRLRCRAEVRSVFLVWEQQDPIRTAYSFEPVHELVLGQGAE